MIVVLALVAGCSPKRISEAVCILEDLQAYDQPSCLKESTPDPVRSIVTLNGAGPDNERGVLYQPPQGAEGSIILIPGVTPRGVNDPRVIAFANTLSRARFDVLVPDLETLWSQKIDAAEADTVADWISYLEERAPGRPLGVVGVSFGVGPALIALFKPTAGDFTDFVVTIGGYHDIDSLIAYVTTGGYRHDESEPWQYTPPRPRAKWVFARTNAEWVNGPADRTLLLAISERKLDDPEADISDLSDHLGVEGQAVLTLLTNSDPGATSDLIAALPPNLKNAIRSLDLRSFDFSGTLISFIVLHDVSDRVIPSSESIKMAEAMGTEAVLIASLDHANVEEPGIGDAIAMFRVVYTILGFRS
jgi:hypothetical protein